MSELELLAYCMVAIAAGMHIDLRAANVFWSVVGIFAWMTGLGVVVSQIVRHAFD